MKFKRLAGLILLITAVIGLPVAVLMNQSVGKVFSRPFTSRVLHEQIFSTPQLAFSLKALVNERIKEVTDLKTGMIVAIFSKADSRKWQELLEGLLPGRLRDPMIDEAMRSMYQWLEEEEVYPDIVIPIQPLTGHLEAQTGFLFRWAHTVANAPVPDAREVLNMQSRNYGDSIPALLMSNVPDSLYEAFSRRGGELMAIQLRNANLTSSLNLTQIIREKVPEKAMMEIKTATLRMQFIADWLWVMVLIILAVGIWLYRPKTREIRPLAMNVLASTALVMLALGWMASNYLLANWELIIHAKAIDVPRAIRDRLIALITYYLHHASAAMYFIGFLLLGLAFVSYATRWVSLTPHFILQLKNKKS